VKLAVVTSGFPRRSETFVLNELLALDAHGLLGPIFATKPGDDSPLQPGAKRLLARLSVLPPVPPSAQARVVAQALARTGVAGIHAYFAHGPAEVAEAAAARVGVRFGFSVHAKDARKATALRERGRAAACVVACNGDVLRTFDGAAELVPHGVDLRRFHVTPERETRFTLLAVGRLVPKKGFDVLVDALTRLRCPPLVRIVGTGPERDRLAARIDAAGLAGRVVLADPLTHEELPAAYADAHAVVVPSVRDETGDRDGLPNVVLEAMACGRAVIATDEGAISSAVRNHETGLLVPSRDSGALATAIERIRRDAELRARLAKAGRAVVERDFDLVACTSRLAALLEEAYA
jgi:glycosyltransferase involved in cell wall biosynthesis